MAYRRQIKFFPLRRFVCQQLDVIGRYREKQRRPITFDGFEDRLRPRRTRIQNAGRPHRQREVKAIPQAVGKEELRHAEKPVLWSDLQNRLGIALRADDHVVLQVNASFGLSGAAGGVKPECRVVLTGARDLQFRGTAVQKIVEADVPFGRRASDDHNSLQIAQFISRDGLNQGQQRLAYYRYSPPAIVEQVLVIGGLQKCVHRNRDGSELDGSEETDGKLRGVEQKQQDALFHAHAQAF